MKKVYVAENNIEVGLMKGLLEDDGIRCLVKNQNLSGALGEIPPLECWPELWVTHDDDFVRANSIIKSVAIDATTNAEAWKCVCGETIEGQFGACWQCGDIRKI